MKGSEFAEQEENACCTIDELTTHLLNLIQKYKNVNVNEISVTEFLKDADYKYLLRENFVNTIEVKLSEDYVWYKNECNEDAKFIHTCQTNQKSSSTVQTSKGHTIGISGGPSVGAFGGNVALSGGYTYSRAKTHQQNEGQGASQSSTVEVTVGKGEAIIVKEMLFEVEKQADCTLELVLEEGQKIEFRKNKKTDKVKVSTEDFKDCKWARIEGNLIICSLTDKCTFYKTERKVISSRETVHFEQ